MKNPDRIKVRIKCSFCSKIFKSSRLQKYCSPCSRQFVLDINKKILEKRKEIPPKMCLVCSKFFVPRMFNAIYCGEICREYSKTDEFLLSTDIEKFKGSTRRWLKLRIMIFDRDGFKCMYCGRSPMKGDDTKLHIDHKYPKNKGGTNAQDNLITACQECNLGKTDFLLKLWENK